MRPVALLAAPLLAALLIAAPAPAAAPAVDAALSAAIAAPDRNPKFVARDSARHPAEELTFFGLKSNANVVEIWPGGGYWVEILAPYLAAHGHYTLALAGAADAEESAGNKRLHELIAMHKAAYGTITETTLDSGHFDIAPPGSADLVLTFRNLHNWMDEGIAEKVLAACFRALKPGGVLGIEAHRGRTDKPQDPKAESGYVREDYAIALAKAAGFEYAGSSEIDANPRDTKDYPKGVWTLPPTLTLGDTDRAKYVAIGEADNFVLRFKKPASAK